MSAPPCEPSPVCLHLFIAVKPKRVQTLAWALAPSSVESLLVSRLLMVALRLPVITFMTAAFALPLLLVVGAGVS